MWQIAGKAMLMPSGKTSRRRWVVRAAAAFALAGLTILCPGQQASAPATSRPRVFARGGDSGLRDLKTPWPDRNVEWVVKSQAGTVASGPARTDKAGLATLRFPVPKVRVAALLVVALQPAGQPGAKGRPVELVVLPRDPFADARKTLGRLKIGLLPGGPLGGALKRSGLRHSDLGRELVRGRFDGKIVVLSGLLAKDVKVTRQYVGSLPAGACLILANDHSDGPSAFSLVDCLVAQRPRKKTELVIRAPGPIWAGLLPTWIGRTCPAHKLGEPRNVLSLGVEAGYVAADGTVYPVAMAFDDVKGRSWLVWNPSEPIRPNDPRWDLLLRNSLRWARQHVLPDRKP